MIGQEFVADGKGCSVFEGVGFGGLLAAGFPGSGLQPPIAAFSECMRRVPREPNTP